MAARARHRPGRAAAHAAERQAGSRAAHASASTSATGPPTRTPSILRLGSQGIDIAPGDGRYVVADRYTLPVDATLLAVQPHAHYRAVDVTGTATFPDGTTRTLIHIGALGLPVAARLSLHRARSGCRAAPRWRCATSTTTRRRTRATRRCRRRACAGASGRSTRWATCGSSSPPTRDDDRARLGGEVQAKMTAEDLDRPRHHALVESRRRGAARRRGRAGAAARPSRPWPSSHFRATAALRPTLGGGALQPRHRAHLGRPLRRRRRQLRAGAGAAARLREGAQQPGRHPRDVLGRDDRRHAPLRSSRGRRSVDARGAQQPGRRAVEARRPRPRRARAARRRCACGPTTPRPTSTWATWRCAWTAPRAAAPPLPPGRGAQARLGRGARSSAAWLLATAADARRAGAGRGRAACRARRPAHRPRRRARARHAGRGLRRRRPLRRGRADRARGPGQGRRRRWPRTSPRGWRCSSAARPSSTSGNARTPSAATPGLAPPGCAPDTLGGCLVP